MKKITGILAVLAAALALPLPVDAAYEGDSDTGAEVLDFIENRRRNEREKQLTAEQKELIAESHFIKNNLRRPLTEESALPAVFLGDDLTYNQVTGEFSAKGPVKIVTMDYQKMTGDGDTEATIRGNTNDEEVEIPGKAHLLKMNANGKHITLDGYNTFYRYGAKTGTMEEAKGKVGHQYVSGKHFEFYPDMIVIYNGTTTKCNAHTPDYHLEAEKITIFPNDRMILEKVKVYAKNKLMFTRDRQVQSLDPNQEAETWPRVGYSNGDGFWIAYNRHRELYPKVELAGRLYWSTKHNFRNRTELRHNNAGSSFKIAYGYYSDIDDNWILRAPSFIFNHDRKIIKDSKFHYTVDFEVGKWKRRQKNTPDIDSTHKYFRVGLYREPLHLGSRWYYRVGAGYQITKETYDDSTRKGYDWEMGLLKEFDPKYAAYLIYKYSVVNTDNALFRYNVNDVGRAIKTGLSYRMTKRDRFIVGVQYDEGRRTVRDVDYYWFHDMHCSQFIVRYRAKRSSWQFRLDFTPW